MMLNTLLFSAFITFTYCGSYTKTKDVYAHVLYRTLNINVGNSFFENVGQFKDSGITLTKLIYLPVCLLMTGLMILTSSNCVASNFKMIIE
jgi:hypothetical protein